MTQPLESPLPTTKRTVPMKVLVVGLCRTGTTSMYNALRQLGYLKTHHMLELLGDPSSCPYWTKALRAKYYGEGTMTREDWDCVLGDYMAVSDYPSAGFAPELIQAYPEAKVILTTRDYDSWYKSVKETIWKTMVEDPLPLPFKLSPGLMAVNNTVKPIAIDNGLGKYGDFTPENGKRFFDEHNEEVRRIMADRSDDFLEFQAGQGWEPLCKFLGVDVPAGDFPRSNPGREFRDLVAALGRAYIAPVLFKWVVIPLATAGAAWWLFFT